MYLFFTFSPLLVCFACFCFVAVDFFFLLAYFFFWFCVCVCVRVCAFKFILCVYVCVCAFKFILIFPSLFILCAVFISLWVGLGLFFRWLETKISYFEVVYKKILSVCMEWAVINELFIILYI